MYPGACAVSPNNLRNSLMRTFKTASLTAVSGQTASSRASLVTNRPACVTRHSSRAQVMVINGSACAPCQRQALAGSNRNNPKTHWGDDGIALPPLLLPCALFDPEFTVMLPHC